MYIIVLRCLCVYMYVQVSAISHVHPCQHDIPVGHVGWKMRGEDRSAVCVWFMAISRQTTTTTIHCVLLSGMKYLGERPGSLYPSGDSICHWTIYTTAIPPFLVVLNDQRGVWNVVVWFFFSPHFILLLLRVIILWNIQEGLLKKRSEMQQRTDQIHTKKIIVV